MNWTPATTVYIKYPSKNYSANLNVIKLKNSESQNFKNAVASAENIGKRIGVNSTFGSVREIGTDGKYVMKTMGFSPNNNLDNLKIFLNEIRVGSIPNINKVGPKIYAWRIIRDAQGVAIKGQYIMDNFIRGDKTLTVETVAQYSMRFKNQCPPTSFPFFKKLREALENFWKITKGYHGDLHMNNIVVLIKPNDDIERIMIFDYGAHKKFKNTSGSCFEDFVRIIDDEFQKRKLKLRYSEYFPKNTKIPAVFGKRGQPRRPNTNMLRGLTPAGKSIQHNFSKMSIMSKIHNQNKARFSGKNLKKMNINGVSHRHAFVSNNIWNEMIGYTRPRNRLVALYKKFNPTVENKNILNFLKLKYSNPKLLINASFNKKFPEMEKNKYINMFRNVLNGGEPTIYNPVYPGNRIFNHYKGTKNEILNKVKKQRHLFNMSNANFKEMINNYKRRY